MAPYQQIFTFFYEIVLGSPHVMIRVQNQGHSGLGILPFLHRSLAIKSPEIYLFNIILQKLYNIFNRNSLSCTVSVFLSQSVSEKYLDGLDFWTGSRGLHTILVLYGGRKAERMTKSPYNEVSDWTNDDHSALCAGIFQRWADMKLSRNAKSLYGCQNEFNNYIGTLRLERKRS